MHRALVLSLLAPAAAAAQTLAPAAPLDTLDALQEVVVEGARGDRSVATVQRVAPREVAEANAAAVAALAPLVPGASVTTNSRGETLVYLRGAGERQLAVFLDGAPLNVPWDHRLDLGLVPAGVVQSMTVSKGPAALDYGANVSGGVLNLVTFAPQRRRSLLTASAGSEATLRASALHGLRAGRFGLVAAAALARTDGQPLPSGAEVPFSQDADALRTNTDLRLASVYLRGTYDASERVRVGLTLLHANAEKGVAPESQLDPASASPRYWRYPDVRTSMAVLSAEGNFARAEVRASAWGQRFGQDIEQYASAAYDRVTVRQEDDDRSAGARLAVRLPFGATALRLVASGAQSAHDQRDRPVTNGTAGDAPRMEYAQRTGSAGATLEHTFAPGLRAEIGGGVDRVDFLKTADKPARDALTAPSFNAGLRFDAAPRTDGSAWHARAAVGHKTRFPTMRELFGEALSRFLVNPDLRPEASWLAEMGVGWTTPRFSVEAMPFATFTDGTIDQENVTVNGQRLRRRINLKGSRVLGIELAAAARLAPAVRGTAHLTAMDIRRLQDTNISPDRLTERPGTVGRFALAYDAGHGPTALAEAVYTGRAYSLGSGSDLVALPRATVVNLRAGYRVPGFADAEAFVRLDNAFDAVTVLQLGLPGPGRMWSVGVRVAP